MSGKRVTLVGGPAGGSVIVVSDEQLVIRYPVRRGTKESPIILMSEYLIEGDTARFLFTEPPSHYRKRMEIK